MKEILIGAIALMMMIGCNDGSTTTTTNTVTNIYETNGTEDINRTLNEFGEGNLLNPYIVNKTGLYEALTGKTIYQTNSLNLSCNIRINPIDNYIYNVEVRDGSYNYLENKSDPSDDFFWYEIPAEGRYNIMIETYKETYFGFASDCMN